MNPRPVQSTTGVNLEHIDTGGGNLTISGVTINTYAQMAAPPPLWVNVPSLPNYFLGRDALVDDLVTRLCAGQSAALSAEGLPGVGKTTLAVVLAYHPQVLAHFSDGVLWTGLGPAADVPSQLAAWATALDIDVSDQPTPAGRARAVRNAIGQRRLLLVIDDAWQAEAAELMRCGGPGCSHLLTTRDQSIARRFAGAAQAVSVPTLADDPAFALLRALAPEACAADREAAYALARRVDGLPLALELLGGYLAAPERSYFRELSAAALDELADPGRRLQLATRRLGSTDDAQVTLHATIALSLDGLPAEAAAAFHALGAFAPKPATFSREAAEAVTEAGAATLALLAARNLLERSDGGAGRLALHQVLADVARTKLEPAAVGRHRDYYLALVDEDREDWERIGLVYAQVQQALAWQVERQADDSRLIDFYRSIGTYQVRQGLWEHYSWLARRCLAWAQANDDAALKATFFHELAFMYDATGEKNHALDYLKQALSADLQLNDKRGEAQTLCALGKVYDDLGDKQQALAYYEQALLLSRQVGDREGEAATLNNIGMMYADLGDQQQALAYFEQALSLFRQVGDRHGEATTLNNIGSVYDALGEKGKALEYYQQALSLSRQVGDRSGEATTLSNIGSVYDALGEKGKALEYYEQTLPVHRQVGNRAMEATTLNNIGLVYSALGEKGKALEYYEQAFEILRQIGDKVHQAGALNNIGVVYSDLGEQGKALAYYEQALPMHRQVGNRAMEATTLHNIGMVYDALGNNQQALVYLEQALPMHRQVGNRAMEAATLNNMALISYQQGNYGRAAETLSAVVVIVRQLGAASEEAVYSFNLANVLHLHLNETARAVELVQRSVALLRQYGLSQDAAGQTLAQHEAFLQQLQVALPSGPQRPKRSWRNLFGR